MITGWRHSLNKTCNTMTSCDKNAFIISNDLYYLSSCIVSSSPGTSPEVVFSGFHVSVCRTYRNGLSSGNVTLPSRDWSGMWLKTGIVFLWGVNENMSCWISAGLLLAPHCCGLYSRGDEFIVPGAQVMVTCLCLHMSRKEKRQQETSRELLSHFSSAFFHREKKEKT